MRLLRREDDGRFTLRLYSRGGELPPYAVLSHTWLSEDEEVNFADMRHGSPETKIEGYKKIRFCSEEAERDGLRFFWVDTCCIDKTNSVELQETINTMFQWYRGANRCYVYMSDVSAEESGTQGMTGQAWETAFRSSRWFTRGWTLQELLAPKFVVFYSKNFVKLGDKHSLQHCISEVTRIPPEALQGRDLSAFSVDERLSWAKGRRTTREEDRAYALMGMMGVFMPLIYGEGVENAFSRLQEEISKRRVQPGQSQNSHLLDNLPVASSAAYDSRENEYEDVCLPNTRVELLQAIQQWTMSAESKCVFWINGSAGTGKSTIARTVAAEQDRQENLGGTFFFSKGGLDLNHADRLFTTLAFQIAQRVPATRPYICDAISDNKDIGNRALREQWNELILKPLSRLNSITAPAAIVMVVDALDECGSENDIAIILKLFRLSHTLKNVRLRILVTSRPEMHIRTGFQHIPKAERHDYVLQDMSQDQIERDILLFFQDRFEGIRMKFELRHGWVSERDMSTLVDRSSGLFIWAATASRYITNGGRFAQRRMTRLLRGNRAEGGPEQQLDQMYLTILRDSLQKSYDEDELKEHLQTLRDLLGSIATLFWPLSIDSLASLLETDAAEVSATLADLHTIINVPGEPGRPLRLHHPSFRDFLLDRNRCDDPKFWIDKQEAHKILVVKCIQIMNGGLKRNICDLDDPGTAIGNISQSRVEHSIPAELRYACLYWAEHCRQSKIRLRDNDFVNRFLEKHFLHWLEVMSLSGRTSYMAAIMRMYQSLLPEDDNQAQLTFIKDSRRFMYSFLSTIETTPLQIYSAAIVYIPPSNTLRHHFWGEIHPRMKTVRIVEAIGAEDKDEYNYVNDLAFTPDGGQVAAGSLDGRVRVWDVNEKTALMKLGDQNDKVSSVSISSDGRHLASGSDDTTVIVLDMATRQSRFKLTGHTRWVNIVAYSPDGKLLATASMDETVRLWDTNNGGEVKVLDTIHTGVNDIDFSPNGTLIALGTVDQMVRLWDFQRDEIHAALDGHSGPVNSVAFLPNSARILSGSDDMSVKVWNYEIDIMTLKGHTDPVWAVTSSPDGRVIASGSADMTVKIWDADTGALLKTLEGHDSGISAVKYTPNGRLLASACFNDEVRLWNADDGASRGKLADFIDNSASAPMPQESKDIDMISKGVVKGHAERVTCVVFSPDGRLVASGSTDTTIKVWTKDGLKKSVLEGHTGVINSIAFTPNGALIASASEDCIAKLWDPEEGRVIHTLKGHVGPVSLVRFSGDGGTVATCSADNTAILWRAADGVALRIREGHTAAVNDVVFSEDGKSIVSCSADSTACLWSTLAAEKPPLRLVGHTDKVNSIAFSPDAKLIASCSSDQTVKVWDAAGAVLHTFEGHIRAVTSISFSPDSRRIASSSEDKTVRIWSLNTDVAPQVLHIGIAIRRISFSASGRRIATERGALRVDVGSFDASLPPASPLFVTEEWIRHNTHSVLWLPDQYRATAVATRADTAVFGHASGAISFIELESTTD